MDHTLIASPPPATPPLPEAPSCAEEVTWQELRRGIWAGRLHGMHVGIIERGRQYVLTDADRTHHSFDTLTEAQDAATNATAIIQPTDTAVVITAEPYSRRDCRQCKAPLAHSARTWGRQWTCTGCGQRSF